MLGVLLLNGLNMAGLRMNGMSGMYGGRLTLIGLNVSGINVNGIALRTGTTLGMRPPIPCLLVAQMLRRSPYLRARRLLGLPVRQKPFPRDVHLCRRQMILVLLRQFAHVLLMVCVAV